MIVPSTVETKFVRLREVLGTTKVRRRGVGSVGNDIQVVIPFGHHLGIYRASWNFP